MKSRKKMILRSASYGAAIGASILFVFEDDSLMAFYPLLEGAIIGAVIGALVGLMIRRAVKMQRRTWQHNNWH
jgi:uncharacterized membrane protein YeaQ/YmgE (transglycosylase-associated protein family)